MAQNRHHKNSQSSKSGFDYGESRLYCLECALPTSMLFSLGKSEPNWLYPVYSAIGAIIIKHRFTMARARGQRGLRSRMVNTCCRSPPQWPTRTRRLNFGQKTRQAPLTFHKGKQTDKHTCVGPMLKSWPGFPPSFYAFLSLWSCKRW